MQKSEYLRMQTEYNLTPGPGSYNLNEDWRAKGAVKLMGRLDVPLKIHSPGPGIYSPSIESIKSSSP